MYFPGAFLLVLSVQIMATMSAKRTATLVQQNQADSSTQVKSGAVYKNTEIRPPITHSCRKRRMNTLRRKTRRS